MLDISLNGISLDEMKKELVEINQKDDSSWTKEEKKEFISDYIVTKLGLSLPDFHLWTNDIWKKIKMVPYSLWREDNDRKIVEENYKKINIIHAIMDQYF
ncbi:MAG: hypothetical protein LBO09_02355 [Candidatus Peribacteria bacterium]|nr:hypothetical protein [Candidatus Peribacteria bacterium]